MIRELHTAHGVLETPAFLPDATRGVVRSLDAEDLRDCGVQGLVVNALHLSVNPGASLVASVGGIHRFMGWDRPVVSDSGGFQVLSLIGGSSRAGGASERGFVYRLGQGGKKTLTPEKSIQRQFQIGSDVMFCLDHCTHPGEGQEAQETSVAHTIAWARRCKEAFHQHLDQRKAGKPRPMLFAVVQGGNDPSLRRRCVEELLEIGFDGYGFGGWPIGRDGALTDMVGKVAELLPEGAPKHALGIGKPENLAGAFRLGYDLFDCAIPTRDARRKRLYTFRGPPEEAVGSGTDFYEYLYIEDERFARDARPIGESCGCVCCRKYSRAYLHHLFEIRDALALRLATLHNLSFYTALLHALRSSRRPLPPLMSAGPGLPTGRSGVGSSCPSIGLGG